MEKNEKKIVKAIAKKPALYEAENEEKLEPQADLPTPENVKPETKETAKARRGRPINSASAKKIVASKTSETNLVVKRAYKKRNVEDVTLNDKPNFEKTETADQRNTENTVEVTEDKNILLESNRNQANLEISNLQKVRNELKKSVDKLQKKIKQQKEKNKKEKEKEKEKLKKKKKKEKKKTDQKKKKLKTKNLKSKSKAKSKKKK